MKSYFSIIVVLALVLTSCATVINGDFIQTGETFSAIPETTEIRVVLNPPVPEYDEIGVVETFMVVGYPGETRLSQHIEEAKKIARLYGGDVVIIRSATNRVLSEDSSIEIQNPDVYTFIIGKLK